MEVRGHRKRKTTWGRRCTDSFSEFLDGMVFHGALDHDYECIVVVGLHGWHVFGAVLF